MRKKLQIADFQGICSGLKHKKYAEASPGTPIYIIKLRKDYQPNRPRTRSMNDGRCCRIWTDTFGDLRSRNIIDE